MTSDYRKGKKVMGNIRRILVDDWDPVGIKGSGPADEYDAYIAGIYRLLITKPTIDAVVMHLHSIEMVPADPSGKDRAALRIAAEKLLELDLSIK